MSRMFVLFSVTCGLLAVAAHAQDAGEAVAPRSQLEMRKRDQAAQFDAQEQACAKTFAVTDCVNEVNARRRVVVAALRKEENALNEVERRQRERERLDSLQEKARQRALQVPPGEVTGESVEDRLQRQQGKMAAHTPQSVPRAPTTPKETVSVDPQTRQRNAANYVARQKAAEERRAARDKKLKEQGQTPADLPTPP